MANLNLRNFPDDVLSEMKVCAFRDGVTLREWCIRRLTMTLPVKDEAAPLVSESNLAETLERVTGERKRKSTPVTQEPVVEDEDVIADEDIPDPEPELPMCTYTEYDPDKGETYGCRLREHGPKIRHQIGDKV